MKPSLTHLNPFRMTNPPSEPGATYGAFAIPSNFTRGETFEVIACDGRDSGWDHVSVKIHMNGMGTRVPFWREMDWIKRQFWDDDEVVVQFHINDGRKKNLHDSVLHLWKMTSANFPTPPKECV